MGIYKLQRVYYKRDIVEYPEGVVKFESSTPGTYDVELTHGIYGITCVAAGSGGTGYNDYISQRGIRIYVRRAQGGGSGSGFSGTFTLSEGTYSIVVGAGSDGPYNATIGAGGNSSVSGVITCYGGGSHNIQSPGGGGGAPTVSLEATNITLNTAGNTGGSVTGAAAGQVSTVGGASVYDGYGAGGSATSATSASGSGGSGYVKILAFREETVVPGTADDYDFYEDKMLKIGEFYEGSTKIGSLYKGSILVFGKTQTIFEQETPGIYTITIPYEADFKITAVGAGGRANYRCVYDDRGYIGCGGSGGAFVGKIHLTAGRYNVQIGSCATNANRDTYIEDVLTVGGGGDGVTNPIGGAAGAAPTFDIQPISQDLNTAGNAGGAYSSGNGGGGATWNYGGAASVYNGYGRGGGGKVCEYASTSTANEASGEPYNPTNGYLKIEI